ncbi:MAG: hypothetical protein IPG12_03690 [Saprospiraceae bacterium]|nr:hypothetical protein [Saprospiraceae bacterium]
MDENFLITTTVTILIAFFGLIITYLNNLRLTKRKEKLELLNKRLGDFYGPLYALLKSNEIAWASFRSKHRPTTGLFFNPEDPPNNEDLLAWMHYIKTVFMPTNERIFETIVSKCDLLLEEHIPDSLLQLISHIVIYRAIIKNWELENYSEYTSIIPFPVKAREYIYQRFEELKKQQFKMINK